MDRTVRTKPGLSAPLFILILLLAGCASVPPVQEMSDARQAIQAAKEAHAEQHAPLILRSAENALAIATRQLEAGQYDSARRHAVEARKQAIVARDRAASAAEGTKKGTEP